MAEAVVDRLEAIEISDRDTQRPVAFAPPREQQRQLRVDTATVRQAGQRIEVGIAIERGRAFQKRRALGLELACVNEFGAQRGAYLAGLAVRLLERELFADES